MTAKEMFEKLGFKQETMIEECINYTKSISNDNGCEINIMFLLDDKCVGASIGNPLLFRYEEYCINPQELQAMYQQMKELGWL